MLVIRSIRFGFLLAFLLLHIQLASGQGIQFVGIGPVNRSMGGAATAAPIDAMGAIHWNPASITGFESSQLSSSLGFVLPESQLDSYLPADAAGPGLPPIDLQGSVQSDAGAIPLPSVGLVLRDDAWPITLGLGIYGTAGFALNYPSSNASPLSSPQPPNGFGAGRIFAEVQVLQIAPVVAMKVSDRLSVGVGPTINMYRVLAEPFSFTAPNDANGDGFFTYPSGTGTRFHWGGGFSVGAFYQSCDCLNFGVSYKSEQWGEDISYQSADELGRPISFERSVTLPAILSMGTAYTTANETLIAVDVRWLDFASTDLLGDDASLAPNGQVNGLGWDSIWSLSIGAQRQICNWATGRIGYTTAEDPIGNSRSGFNFQSPLISQHVLSVGTSVQLTGIVSLDLAYQHGFSNQVEGAIESAGGPIPGSRQASTVSFDLMSMGVTAQF